MPTSTAASATLERLGDLPVLPMVVARLLAIDKTRDDYFDEVVRLVALEPTFAAKLIASANTVENRGQRKISNLKDAAVRLGARRVSGLVVSMGVVRVFAPNNDWERSLWRHAIEVACGARHLVRLSGDRDLDAEAGYLAGLLHDMGRFLLFDVAPEELQRVDSTHWSDGAALVAAERAIVGMDHAELGAKACERWQLPSALTEIVQLHHAPRRLAKLNQNTARLGQLVHVADVALFGSLHHGQPALCELSQEDAMERLRGVLPRWYPPCSPRMVQGLLQAEKDAQVAVELLGVA